MLLTLLALDEIAFKQHHVCKVRGLRGRDSRHAFGGCVWDAEKAEVVSNVDPDVVLLFIKEIWWLCKVFGEALAWDDDDCSMLLLAVQQLGPRLLADVTRTTLTEIEHRVQRAGKVSQNKIKKHARVTRLGAIPRGQCTLTTQSNRSCSPSLQRAGRRRSFPCMQRAGQRQCGDPQSRSRPRDEER